MTQLAPIAIFAFKRLDLLKQTLRSLEACAEFPDSHVLVFSDSARSCVPGEEKAVLELRQWLRPWCAQRGATLHEANVNKGLRISIISGVTFTLEQHERVIVLEDDIVVSPSFLAFMNDALESCKNRTEIFQVSGYNVPHQRKLPGTGLLRVPGCWGWATWQRAWREYSDDAAKLLRQVLLKDVNAFNINSTYNYLESLERNAVGLADTWMVRWYASVYLRAGLTVYPGISLTRNIGFDKGGTNCTGGRTSRIFSRQRVGSKMPRVDWSSIGSAESPEFASALEEFYRWQQEQWGRPSLTERLQAKYRRLAREILHV